MSLFSHTVLSLLKSLIVDQEVKNAVTKCVPLRQVALKGTAGFWLLLFIQMDRVVKTVSLIRNNWKKSLFFSGLLSYGASVALERYRIKCLMRSYCLEACKIGEQALLPYAPPRHLTVILNPEANKRKAKVHYEKYVAPILHCAGLKVSLMTTEMKGQAEGLMEIMTNTDAVLIAGGDGTIHESVTGLIKRKDGKSFPMGIVPLGASNMSARSIHGSDVNPVTGSATVQHVKRIADATLSVVRETVKQIDVLALRSGLQDVQEVLQEGVNKEDGQKKQEEVTIACINSINYGLIRDVLSQTDRYWIWGNRLKPFIAMASNVIWRRVNGFDRSVQIEYTDPCSGCSRCSSSPEQKDETDRHQMEKKRNVWRFFAPFISRQDQLKSQQQPLKQVDANVTEIDCSNIVNEECGVWHKLNPEVGEKAINLLIRNEPNSDHAELLVHTTDSISKGSLILDAGDVYKGIRPAEMDQGVKFRDLRITFDKKSDGETEIEKRDHREDRLEKESDEKTGKSVPSPPLSCLSLDNEVYPVSDVKIERLRRKVTVYSMPYPLFRL